MKALQRLEELLDERDARIEELCNELEELKESEKADWKWVRHRTLKSNPDKLPVPRLEIRAHNDSGDWYNWRWEYSLIYKHLLGHLVLVPLGSTTCNGGRGKPPMWENGNINTPFRDGVHIAHDAKALNLPAFAICDGRIRKLWMGEKTIEQEDYNAESSQNDA